LTPEELAARDPLLAECLRVGGAPLDFSRPSGFEGLIRIIFEQQLSVRAADAVWAKVALPLDPVAPETLLALGEERLRGCGVSSRKIDYARGVARAVVDGSLDFDDLSRRSDDEIAETLIAFKGIGRWSVDMYLIGALQRPDVWPVGDLAIRQGVQRLLGRAEPPPVEELIERAEPWRPHRTLAARLVWRYHGAMKNLGRAP